MIEVQKIIDEVNILLISKYKEFDVYINKVPEGFNRPSFFIELIDYDTESATKDFTLEKVWIRVIYFSPEDEYGVNDSIDKNRVLSNMVHIFRRGYVKVEDRSLGVAIESSYVDNEATIDLKFEYMEKRLEEDEEPTYETVGEIIINNKGGVS